jgi:transposase
VKDLSINISQQDLVLVLHAQGRSATTIHQHLVEAFGELAISSVTASRTIRSLSWNPIDDESQNFGGRPSNQLIDVRILKILDNKPGVSVHEIAHAVSIRASTAWYVLTTRLGYTWRKCRTVRSQRQITSTPTRAESAPFGQPPQGAAQCLALSVNA